MADAKKDAVAELHDNVNVVIMLATFAASALSLAGLPPGHEAVVYGSIAYTLVDGLWIAARPSMVATPVGIVAHHVVVLGMLYGPIEIPDENVRVYLSLSLSALLATAVFTPVPHCDRADSHRLRILGRHDALLLRAGLPPVAAHVR